MLTKPEYCVARVIWGGSYLEELVHQNQGYHCLHHGDGSGYNTGIMPPPCQQIDVLPLPTDSVLLFGDGRGGLEGDLDDYVLPIGKPPLDPSRPAVYYLKALTSLGSEVNGGSSIDR